MRIVIMGTGPFALPTCRRLIADGHDIPLVVTRPLVGDPPPKRRLPRPVFDWASSEALPIYEPASINAPEALERLHSVASDLFFVCDYGQILSRECLSMNRLGGINLHGSLLPRHRGAAPVQWTILEGDPQAGVTVIHMTPRLDAGPALATARTEVRRDENAAQLESRLAALGVDATARAIAMLEEWDQVGPIGELQDQSLVTRAPRFSKADGQLDFRLSADYLERLVRACQPWPGTFAELEWSSGKRARLLVRAARALPTPPSAVNQPSAAAEPGMVTACPALELPHDLPDDWEGGLQVTTGDGVLLLGRVQPAGKREMSAAEFLRGHGVDGGVRFSLPG